MTMMTSSIRSSRNVRLIPSVRDEWNGVCVDMASSMNSNNTATDNAVKYDRNDNIHPCIHKELTSKFQRAPHCLRMDHKRVSYFNCELYTIPEDEAVCDSHQFEREESVPVQVVDPIEAVMSKEFQAIILQNERMIRVNQKKTTKGDTQPGNSKELHVPGDFGNKRSQAWNSEQFDAVLQDLEDNESWENELDENNTVSSESSLLTVQ